MRFSGIPRLAPAATILAALAAATFLFAHAPVARAECGTASSTPCPPTPTPTLAFISLDVTAGDANTVITVTGGQFLPNEQMNLYWDSPNQVVGNATADASGSFGNVKVKPFAGAAPGGHKICAGVQPNPCAQFAFNGPPSPSPSASPEASPSPSDSPAPAVTDLPSSSPVAVSLSGFDVISRPPFVFLPIAGALGVVLSVGYWLVAMMRRPRQRPIPTAAVMHRAMRPDYTAGFGAPPPAPSHPDELSAWNEPVHEMPAPAPAPQPPPASSQPPPEPPAPEVDWGPPVEWGTGSGDWGFPEPPPDDNPEAPPPAD